MSRLRKQAQTVKLYHATSIKVLEQITQSGMLMPQESRGGGAGTGSRNDKSRYEGHTFFATKLNRALDYGTSANFCVLELNLEEDALLPDDDDMPTAKTWQDSANKIAQVKVNGSIPDTYIKRVHFYINTDLQDSFKNEARKSFTTSYANWQEEYQKQMEKLTSGYSEPGDDEEGVMNTLAKSGIQVDANGLATNVNVSSVADAVNTFYYGMNTRGMIMEDGTLYVNCFAGRNDDNMPSGALRFIYLPERGGVAFQDAKDMFATVDWAYLMQLYHTYPQVIQAIMTYMSGLTFGIYGETYPCDEIQQLIEARIAKDNAATARLRLKRRKV